MDDLAQDLRYGLRSLWRSPGFTVTAIAVLALGIGINVAEVHGIRALDRNLAIRQPESLYKFNLVTRGGVWPALNQPAFDFYRRYNTVLSSVIADRHSNGITSDSDPNLSTASFVSGNYFRDLGVTAARGRVLDEEDDRPGAPPSAVISYGYWQNRLGQDATVLRGYIRLNGRRVQVVGIADAHFTGLEGSASIWLPLSMHHDLLPLDDILAGPSSGETAMYGRPAPGISTPAMEAQFQQLTAEFEARNPKWLEPGSRLLATSVAGKDASGEQFALTMIFFALVLLVLLVACANLGNMLLARGLARQHEIRIRLALGAGRSRIVRQLMTENLLLAGIASVAALAVGTAFTRWLWYLTGSTRAIVTDWPIVVSAAGFGLLAVLAFGLAPAFQTARIGRRNTRARQFLVTVQVTLSCVLLIIGALLTHGLVRYLDLHISYDLNRVIVIDPGPSFRQVPPPVARQSLADAAARLRLIPGVRAVTLSGIPGFGYRAWRERDPGSSQTLSLNDVDATWFQAMNTPLLRGRVFAPGEADVILVSQSAAHALWGDRDPLGETLPIVSAAMRGDFTPRSRRVIGVVRDTGTVSVDSRPVLEVYLPIEDQRAAWATLILVTDHDAQPLLSLVRSAAPFTGSGVAIFTLVSQFRDNMARIRTLVTVADTLGSIATLLAAVGMAGLIAFTVTQRSREIGIRMALGASPIDVLRAILSQYTRPFGLGAAIAVPVSAGLAMMIRAVLYGLPPLDPVSYLGGLGVFVLIALVAALLPARRALRIDPASSLRHD